MARKLHSCDFQISNVVHVKFEIFLGFMEHSLQTLAPRFVFAISFEPVEKQLISLVFFAKNLELGHYFKSNKGDCANLTLT